MGDPDLVEDIRAELIERKELQERLSRITSSISHRQPLQSVLDAVTQGAADLLGDEIVGLRLMDPSDRGYVIVVSQVGLEPQEVETIQRTEANLGAGGLAAVEDRLVVMEDYASWDKGLGYFRKKQLQAALAAPVHEGDYVAGSLAVATYRKGRTYSASEKDALVALADHASLALSDAKIVEEMREAQRSKDMFLAMLSHELKTPLTVIMGTLRMLERGGTAMDLATRQEMLGKAAERGLELQAMIDQLLEGSSAELADEPRGITVADLMTESVSGFENTFRIRMADPPEYGCKVPVRTVSRVLGIFLENALAHSPSGSPIKVGAGVSGRSLSAWVENLGELPDDSSSLFEPFSRGDETSRGVGLGLYIAARLARSMGGELKADGGEGVVRFELTVPEAVTEGLRTATH